jgi:hypothetical protein
MNAINDRWLFPRKESLYPHKIVELSCVFNKLNTALILRGDLKVKVFIGNKAVLWGYDYHG